MAWSRELDTYTLKRLGKSLNMPDLIDVIWLVLKLLQNIKYILNTMTIWDPRLRIG